MALKQIYPNKKIPNVSELRAIISLLTKSKRFLTETMILFCIATNKNMPF